MGKAREASVREVSGSEQLGVQTRTFSPKAGPVWEAVRKSGNGEGLCGPRAQSKEKLAELGMEGMKGPLRALNNEKPWKDFESLV